MSYVGGVRNSQGENPHPVGPSLYVVCDTAAATAAKVVSYSDFDALLPGVEIRVKFIYSNTAASPTLNVNDSGAKPIVLDSVNRPGTTPATSWYPNSIVSFTYDEASDVWRISNPYQTALAAEASARASADTTASTELAKCVKNSSQSFTDAQKSQARQNIVGGWAPLKFTGVSATFGSGGSGDYVYRATVPLTGVTSAMIATVIFPKTQAENGNYSPYCQTYDGGVYLYSSVTGTVTGITVVVQRWDN